MRTRVAAVGGDLAIRSAEGTGVSVMGEVPVSRLPAGSAGTGIVSDAGPECQVPQRGVAVTRNALLAGYRTVSRRHPGR